MNTILQDLRYGGRTLLKNRAFTATAVFTLAVGICANATIFSVVNAALINPLPFAEADRLAMVWHENRKLNDNRYAVSYLNFLDYKGQNQSFEEMAGVSPNWSLALRDQGSAEQVSGYFVSASFFPLLGARPACGRVISAEDDSAQAAPVVVLSHRLWQKRYAGDESVIGRSVTFDTGVATVIGVMPADFRFLDDVDLWMPLAHNPMINNGRQVHFLTVFGRLKPGVSVESASAEAATIAAQMELQYRDTNADLGGRAVSLREDLVGKTESALLILMGAVGILLLIACANIANLLLARSTSRRREVAVRMALGAGHARLIRQLLTESLLLASIGGAAGLLMSVWSIDMVRVYSPENLPGLATLQVDGAVVLFTFLATAGAGLLFGLAPAFQSAKVSLQESLRDSAPSLSGGAGRAGRWFVIAELALSLVLLVGAGLLVRSFVRLLTVDPGFNPEGVLTFQIGLPRDRYHNGQQLAAFNERFFESMRGLPGVQAVGGVNRLPLRASLSSLIQIEGRQTADNERLETDFRRVSTDYFQAMGMRVVEGRGFTEQDSPERPPAVIINQKTARTFFPGEEPIGKRIRFATTNPDAPWWTIIGIVADVRHFSLEQEARPEIYLPFSSGTVFSPMTAIRTNAADPAALLPAVRERLREIESLAPIYNIASMPELVSQSVAQRRFIMSLLSIFSAVALLLAGVGLYGVMSYTMAQRTREIGLRLALGAQARDVILMVMRQGLILAAAGVGIGTLAALALTRLMSSLLFGISATDITTFLLVAPVLAGVALTACILPALRAAKIDPIVALRCD